jgi:hypothetical protein
MPESNYHEGCKKACADRQSSGDAQSGNGATCWFGEVQLACRRAPPLLPSALQRSDVSIAVDSRQLSLQSFKQTLRSTLRFGVEPGHNPRPCLLGRVFSRSPLASWLRSLSVRWADFARATERGQIGRCWRAALPPTRGGRAFCVNPSLLFSRRVGGVGSRPRKALAAAWARESKRMHAAKTARPAFSRRRPRAWRRRRRARGRVGRRTLCSGT